MRELRRVEIKVGSEWIAKRLLDIKSGDVFRLFEPDGTPVEVDGKTEFTASRDASLGRDPKNCNHRRLL